MKHELFVIYCSPPSKTKRQMRKSFNYKIFRTVHNHKIVWGLFFLKKSQRYTPTRRMLSIIDVIRRFNVIFSHFFIL